jgi:septation ring formation regulator EzrA
MCVALIVVHVGSWSRTMCLRNAFRSCISRREETKLSIFSGSVIQELLGSGFSYDFLPAIGTRGGTLMA